MIINAQNPSDFGATYLSATTPKVDITNYVDWFENAERFTAYRSTTKYSELELTILVEGSTSAEKEKNISDLINELMLSNNDDALASVPTVDLTSEKGYYFQGYYDSHNESVINAYASEVTFTLIGQKLLAGQSITLTGSGVISVNGNCAVPTNVIFTASTSGTLTIKINDTSYKMDITNGSSYKIDSFNGLFTKDSVNDIINYKSFSFPVLASGTNNIVFTSGLVDGLTFSFNGRLK